MGIEPTFSGWKPNVLNNLPLYDTRITRGSFEFHRDSSSSIGCAAYHKVQSKTTLTNASTVSSDHVLKEWSGRSPQADEGLDCFVQ